jgi:hypothetical protein
VLVGATIFFVATPTGRYQLRLSFTEVPAVYTELYFPSDRPVATSSRGVTTVHFSIRSHESKTTTFRYTVSVFDGSKTATSDGAIALRVGERGDVTASVPTGSMDWTHLAVDLDDRPERLAWTRTASNEVFPS